MSDPTMTPSPHAPEPPDPETPEREPFLKRIRLENFLSFGPDSGWIDLKSLNVLIGPNGAGKSNFIEALQILRYAPTELELALGLTGKASDYPWKGSKADRQFTIEAQISNPGADFDLLYSLRLNGISETFGITSELLREIRSPFTAAQPNHGIPPLVQYIQNDADRSSIAAANPDSPRDRISRKLGPMSPNRTALFQRKDPVSYPEAFYLTSVLPEISIFRFVDLDSTSNLRRLQSSDVPLGKFLNEFGSNLAKTLQDFNRHEGVLESINERLREFLPSFRRFHIHPGLNSFEIQFLEEGFKQPIPAARLSDGTLRYLVLLVILLHPDPPPLICIEEPEIGLHPDIVPEVGRLLRDASTRTQLIVTTHSDVLIDALSGVPETVVVCEKEDGITRMERLSLQELDAWLADYSLGHLWRKGTIGGNRW
jgi:predicted ATPase